MTVTLPENPFEIRKATDEKRAITIGVDDAFASRSRSFMKTALLQLERIDRSQFDEGSEILVALHNLFIGLELSLKVTLSWLTQMTAEDWLRRRYEGQKGHRLAVLAKAVRENFDKLSEEDRAYLEKQLVIIETFVSYGTACQLHFQSTRYPIDSEGELFKYMKETIEVDMTLLIEWARQLIKACDGLSAVGDVLDDARSSFDPMNERRHNDKNTDNP